MSTTKSFSNATSKSYAGALFEVAIEGAELEKIEKNLSEFLTMYNLSPDFISFIKNPTNSKEIQYKAIEIISEKLNFTKNLKNFLNLLVEKRRIFFIKKIIKNFSKLCSHHRGEIEASLISSKNLSKEDLNEISLQFSQSLGAKIKFNYSVDESLIGGVKIQFGSLMVDTSIKNKLKKYEKLMIEN